MVQGTQQVAAEMVGEGPCGVLMQRHMVAERKTTPVGQILCFEDEVVKGAQAGVLPQVIPASREVLKKTTSA